MKTTLTVVLLLVASNTFMTIAWYGHLRYKQVALLTTILVSWLIALPEYALQVPANRLGHGHFTATQLKVIQEVVSLSVFAVCVFLYLGERPTWRSGRRSWSTTTSCGGSGSTPRSSRHRSEQC